MIPRDVKSPTAPIPFHKLLRVVAIVDREVGMIGRNRSWTTFSLFRNRLIGSQDSITKCRECFRNV